MDMVAAVTHLSNFTVGEIARHAKHAAIVLCGTMLFSGFQHRRFDPERHILVSAHARPLHLAQFTGDAQWKKPEIQRNARRVENSWTSGCAIMASSSAKMFLGCFLLTNAARSSSGISNDT